MPRAKHRLCLGCSQPFSGRADAKTCSAKCRKRFQRARILYRDVLQADEQQIDYRPRSYGLVDSRRGQYARR